ncbi:hypothetical protein, partial [Ligilactobacillus murinus]|uniref:hypothetical protein n=1 Tax=Ligilactobacillus murinus TaxID=1622 RepID=UPI001CDBC779
MLMVQTCSFLYYFIAPYLSIVYKKLTNAWELRKLGDIVKWKKGRKLTKAVINECGKGNEVIHYADLYKF